MLKLFAIVLILCLSSASAAQFDPNSDVDLTLEETSSENSSKLFREASGEDDLDRRVRERKQNVEKYRKMLQGLIRKGSLYNTLPIDADVFDQYMSNYMNTNDKRFFQKRSGQLSVENLKLLDAIRNGRGAAKRAGCGQLAGNRHSSKWMCW